jgi:16S rRNA (guanine966-N2)-methyltransferase
MRIVGGEWSGRRLLSAKGGVRPTQDRVRQILFDIIGPAIAGGAVLDLYAGTGALGLESLSRGAASAVFVEADATVAGVLRRNCELLAVPERVRILRLPVARALRILEGEGASFRWILADPPYDSPDVVGLLARLGESPLLAQGGGVVLEARASAGIAERRGALRCRRERRAGGTVLLFYDREPAPEESRSERNRET